MLNTRPRVHHGLGNVEMWWWGSAAQSYLSRRASLSSTSPLNLMRNTVPAPPSSGRDVTAVTVAGKDALSKTPAMIPAMKAAQFKSPRSEGTDMKVLVRGSDSRIMYSSSPWVPEDSEMESEG